jgi:hypothetical protein
MKFPCYTLSKGSSSYTYIGVHYFGSGTTVDAILNNTLTLATARRRWNPSAALDIELFQVLLSPPLRGPF